MNELKTSRRGLIKWGAIAPALAGASHMAFAKAAPKIGALDAMLVDTRFADLASFEPNAPKVLQFTGDVTRIWYHELDARWRARGFTLGGITGSDALFVLENLAQQQGRRVVHRQELAPKDARGIAPVSWVIAPFHRSVQL